MNTNDKILKILIGFKLKESTQEARELHKFFVRMIIDSAFKHYPDKTKRPRMAANNYLNLHKRYIDSRAKYIQGIFGVNVDKDRWFPFYVSQYDAAHDYNNVNQNQNNRNDDTQKIADHMYDTYFTKLPIRDKMTMIKNLPSPVLTEIAGRVLLSAENIKKKRTVSNKNYTKNVTTWMNANMMPANNKNISPTNHAFLMSNLNNTSKIRTVYDIKGLMEWLNKSNAYPKTQPSPMTRKFYKKNNIRKFPPRGNVLM